MQRKFLLVALYLGMACGTSAGFKPVKDATIEEMLGGEKSLRILNSSPEIEVFRIGESKEASVKFPTKEFAELRADLADVKNYGTATMCDFDPAVRLHFATDAGTLDLIICFNCGEMLVKLDGVPVKRDIPFAHGTMTFSDALRVKLLEIARKAFPKDRKLLSTRSSRL